MREIKFRAWDGKKMRFVTEIHFMLKALYVHSSELSGWVGGLDNDLQFKTIMQFTGVFDKNGKEIYEGDVIKHNCGRKTAEVFWSDIYARWGARSIHNCFYVLAAIKSEVIGNIYEHPELLK